MSEECRSCHAPIDWAVKFPEEFKPDGSPKTAPVNHDSADDPAGNLEVWREAVIPTSTGEPAMVLRFRYLKKGEEPAPGHHRGVSHFASCPNAAGYRKPALAPRELASASGSWPRGSNGEAANRASSS